MAECKTDGHIYGGYERIKCIFCGEPKPAEPLTSKQHCDLPSWEFCAHHVEGGTACALERFIYTFEPIAHEAEVFRRNLQAVLAEARADFESEPCQCARCSEPPLTAETFYAAMGAAKRDAEPPSPSQAQIDMGEMLLEVESTLTDLGWHKDRGVLKRVTEVVDAYVRQASTKDACRHARRTCVRQGDMLTDIQCDDCKQAFPDERAETKSTSMDKLCAIHMQAGQQGCPACESSGLYTPVETSDAQPWKCTICNTLNPDDVTHCRQCEYSRMVTRDGQLVPRDGRL